MTYQEQLKDKRWLYKRLEIFIRDKFKCYLCNYQSINNHVHHRKYVKGKLAWEYKNKDLVTLCNECHRKVHYSLIQNRKIEETKIGFIINNLFQKIFNE